jgi:hypothetical protein
MGETLNSKDSLRASDMIPSNALEELFACYTLLINIEKASVFSSVTETNVIGL